MFTKVCWKTPLSRLAEVSFRHALDAAHLSPPPLLCLLVVVLTATSKVCFSASFGDYTIKILLDYNKKKSLSLWHRRVSSLIAAPTYLAVIDKGTSSCSVKTIPAHLGPSECQNKCQEFHTGCVRPSSELQHVLLFQQKHNMLWLTRCSSDIGGVFKYELYRLKSAIYRGKKSTFTENRMTFQELRQG